MPSWLPLLLGFLTAINPVSTDMYLPAFPAIESSLGTASGAAQLTLATWFLGLAVGQITQGTLSDRFGRRGPLLVGTALYTVASVGCALSTDLVTLSAFRFVAAFGASASSVIPRAIVRDVADGLAAARVMSRLMLVMGVAPILAPTLGGFLLGVASWRAIFWVTTAYGVVSMLLVWRFLPDTLPVQMRMRLGFTGLLSRYVDVATDRAFITNVVMGAFVLFVLFAYLSGAPEVFIAGFGLDPQRFAILFGLNAAGFIAVSQINPRLVARFGPHRVIRWGVFLSALAVLVLVFNAVLGLGGMLGIFLPIMASTAAGTLVLPNAAVAALSRHASRAGSASALMGTLQFSIAALATLLVGLFSDGTARPMALTMLIGVAGALCMHWLRPKR
ncbi:multidrug effflux MFS transporter [Roseomonas sp. BN140053]|uniref:multidrug effflux MFS transporter n=1 Tax=Roseomonas sp. BN140053 TaxID=3391898 RepID=UPI0039E8BEC4